MAQVIADRTVLPVAPPPEPEYVELDVRDAKQPKPFKVTAPDEAPNFLLVLVDDLGFARTSTFGSPVNTATVGQLAKDGLWFVGSNTTAACSPTHVAIKII